MRSSRFAMFRSPFLPLFAIPLLVAIAVGGSPRPAHGLTPGLVAAYAFDEGTGTLASDVSGNLLWGSVQGATWTSAGKYNDALTFGVGNYVDLGNPAPMQLTGSVTLSAWVYPTAYPSDDGMIVAKSDISSGWHLKTTPDTGVRTFAIAISPGTSGHTQRYSNTVWSLNTWYYVTGVYDAAAQTLDIYVNGVLDNGALSGTVPASQYDATVSVDVGRRSGITNDFTGVIDEVRIYNRALTPTEIQSDMNTPVTPPGLTIHPKAAALTFTRTQQFTTNGTGVIWLVDGVEGGSAATGTITPGGLYTPPATVGTHSVSVMLNGLSESASAIVHVTNYPGVYTHHYDNMRTGANLSEAILTHSSVSPSTFGKLVSYPLDGLTIASPLYVANLEIPGQGSHNVVYVATEHNSVYAFDADGDVSTPLWHVSFLGPGVTTVPCADEGGCGDIPVEIGITGTPVIDPATGTLYVVAKTKEGGSTYVYRLHALDITTGAEKFGGPQVLQASVPGVGLGSSGGVLDFNTLRENQRPALLLENGILYIAFGSHEDQEPFHGWVMGYDPTTLQQTFAWCSTPDNNDGGVWQGGGGLAADASGDVYFATGDGAFNANGAGGNDYGDSVIRMSPSGSVLDYFTPFDQYTLDVNNLDLCAGGVILLPDQPGPHPHEIIAAGKNRTIYLLDRDNMGHFNALDNSNAVQALQNIFSAGSFSNPVYFDGKVYFCPVSGHVQYFLLNNGLLSTTPDSQSSETFGYPGGTMAVSANGSSDGILWAMQRNGTTAPGVLYAYDANNLGTVLYNSNAAGARDVMDYASKFTIPVIANGKVFVATATQLNVFGEISLPTVTAVEPTTSSPPKVSTVVRATPNPFSGSTNIRFRLGSAGTARLRVFDVSGRLVRSFELGRLPQGEHEVVWSGTDQTGRSASSGIYFAQVETADGLHSTRIVLIK
jgi:hypothetical protein